MKSRIKIGGMLFGWLDRHKNIENIKLDAFHADLYAAFYHWIPPRKMLNAINDADFDVIDSFPAITLEHWFKGNPNSKRAHRIQYIISILPFTKMFFYSLMRLRQWLWGGDNRTYYAKKKE